MTHPAKARNLPSLVKLGILLVGDAQLATAMKCAQSDVADYLSTMKQPSTDELGRLLDLIVFEHGKVVSRHGTSMATLREAVRSLKSCAAPLAQPSNRPRYVPYRTDVDARASVTYAGCDTE